LLKCTSVLLNNDCIKMKNADMTEEKKISLRSIFLISLSLIIFLPIVPLSVATWYGYVEETTRLVDEQKDANKQIGFLSERLLEESLLRIVKILNDSDFAVLKQGTQPFLHWEEVDKDDIVIKSTLGVKREGLILGSDIHWQKVTGKGEKPFEVSSVTKVDGLKYPAVMLRTTVESYTDGIRYRVAYLDPSYMYERLTSAFRSSVNRHVYAVDMKGNPIFYSNMVQVLQPDKIKQNPTVKYFLDGQSGTIRYVSTISMNERIGYVHPVSETGWAIIVSADISTKLVRVKDRVMKVAATLMLAVVLALVVFLYFSRRMIVPLTVITRQIRRASVSDEITLKIPASVKRIAEFSQLIQDFDYHISKSRKAEEKHVQAEKMASMGEIAAGLAHEIGTPLNVVRGNAQYLLRKHPQDSSEREILDKIVNQTNRIAELIRNLLDLARPDDVKPERFNVSSVVEKSLTTIVDMYPQVQVSFEKDDVLPDTVGFPRKLEHVFLNLFNNACQAMDGKGALAILQRIVQKGEDKDILLIITDTGCGMDHSQISQIFKPFYSTKGSGKGTGLGLAIVERGVKEHGGSIYVESETGKGATFYISLPIVSELEKLDLDEK